MRDDLATSPIVIDGEMYPHPGYAAWLEPVQAARNLKDPVKIAADIAEKTEARLEKLGLDPFCACLAVIGYWTAEDGLVTLTCRTEQEEAAAITQLWDACLHRTIVGYNLKGFDLRFLVTRSRLLRIKYPQLDFSPYRNRGVIDLFLELTFNDGPRDQGAMRRTLGAMCKRFGIPFDNAVGGKDVAALIAAGNWDAVIAHCAADVTATVELARRLGVVTHGAPARV